MIRTGIIRKIDELGRITIPSGICGSLGIVNGVSSIDVWLQDDMVALQRTEESNQNALYSRLIDRNGRYIIPKEIRVRLGLDYGVVIEFFLDGKTIFVKRSLPYCKLCYTTENLVRITSGDICKKCGSEAAKALKSKAL